MRSFFQNILKNFHLYSGNRPAEKLSDEEVTTLLNILERVSKNYEYIPKEEQQKIIEGQLIADRTYYNLNARTVAGWLELNGKKYFKEVAHQPTKEHEPATDEQKEYWMNEWKKALANVDTQFTQAIKGNGARMREQLDAAGIDHSKAPQQKESSALEDACAKTGDYAETKTENDDN